MSSTPVPKAQPKTQRDTLTRLAQPSVRVTGRMICLASVNGAPAVPSDLRQIMPDQGVQGRATASPPIQTEGLAQGT